MSDNNNIKIAVIGLGAQGLVAVKNLLEEGFDVTGFEKNNFVGGIWHYSAETRISVLPTTIVNSSKERACFSDFPYPDDCPSYPTSAQVDQYLNNYCDHFKLWPHLRLSTTLEKVHRDDATGRWTICVRSVDSENVRQLLFDKLVVALGPNSLPIEPMIHDRHNFKGQILHSIAFRDQRPFKGKRVMVIGASNTAADTCTTLVGIADKVYFSHRNPSLIVPRYLKNGTILDHGMNYRIVQAIQVIESYYPGVMTNVMQYMVNKMVQGEFGVLDPAWKLTPTPSIKYKVPTVSDYIIPYLRAGKVTSTAAPKRIVGDYEVELEDGTILPVDVIISCTGYDTDFTVMGKYDPTLTPEGTYDHYTPGLYQNVLSLDFPDSLAYIGIAIAFQPAFLTTDLSTMALAQLWSTKETSPSLPSTAEMKAWHLKHIVWVESVRSSHPRRKMIKFSIPDGPWMRWVQETAGINLDENLAWTSLKAWKFWWNDRKFCNLLIDGIHTPIFYRLFDSDRRKKWDGARAAIEKMNADVRRDVEMRKAARKQKEKAG